MLKSRPKYFFLRIFKECHFQDIYVNKIIILLLYLLLTCAGSSSFQIFSSALKDSTLAPFLAFIRTKWDKWRFDYVMDYIAQEMLLDQLILRRKQFKMFKEVWLFYIQVFFYIQIVHWIYLIGIVITIFLKSKRFFSALHAIVFQLKLFYILT